MAATCYRMHTALLQRRKRKMQPLNGYRNRHASVSPETRGCEHVML